MLQVYPNGDTDKNKGYVSFFLWAVGDGVSEPTPFIMDAVNADPAKSLRKGEDRHRVLSPSWKPDFQTIRTVNRKGMKK